MFEGVPRRAPPPFGGRLVVMVWMTGASGGPSGFSGGSQWGCVESGAVGFGGASSWSTDVSMWSVGASCALLKLVCVAVDPLLESEEDALGSKLKLV